MIRGKQTGAALLTVLTVVAALAVVVSIVVESVHPGYRAWAREHDQAQALYLAESGIAFQLYLERYSDSADPAFSPPAHDSGGDSAAAEKPATLDTSISLRAPADTFRFHLDTSLGTPEVAVDRSRAFLDITAKARYHEAEAAVTARFGKALDDSVFGPALTLDNPTPLEPFPREHVTGMIRVRTPTPGLAALPWPQGLSMTAYAAQFTDKKYFAYESALEKKLGEEGAQSGNGEFTRSHPPEFGKDKGGDIVFTLGNVEIKNESDRLWTIRGPGRIFAEGEIRVKGFIRFENVNLFAGKDVTFEDSVTGEGLSVYARGSVYFHDRCNVEVEAVAGKDIVLRDRSQTGVGSVLLSVGKAAAGPGSAGGGDSLNAIRVVNDAVARGFLIAGGDRGRVALATPANRVEGVVMAASVWIGGEVDGPVVARTLLCEGTNTKNCLGPGRIDRSKLPPDFVQPLELGPQDRRTYRFKLLDWKRS